MAKTLAGKQRADRRKKLKGQLKVAKGDLRNAIVQVTALEKELAKVSVVKMKPGRGRNKGSNFERVVAKMVTETFAPFGVTAEECYRTPLSGGHWAAKGTDPGDLQMSPKLAALFPFSVECKCYKKINWMELFHNLPAKGQIATWWAQCEKASKGTGRQPLLVFKQNGSDVFCMFLNNEDKEGEYPSELREYGPTTLHSGNFTVIRLTWLLAGYQKAAARSAKKKRARLPTVAEIAFNKGNLTGTVPITADKLKKFNPDKLAREITRSREKSRG